MQGARKLFFQNYILEEKDIFEIEEIDIVLSKKLTHMLVVFIEC